MKNRLFRNLMIFFVACFISSTGPVSLVRAGDKDPAWSGEIIRSKVIDKIEAVMHKLEAKPGYQIVEIVGRFNHGGTGASGLAEKITLTPKGREKATLRAIGMPGKKEACSYMLLSGFTGSVNISFKETGEQFGLERKKKDAPYVFTLEKTPCRLCLGFIVPEDAVEGFLLKFMDATIEVPKVEGKTD